MTGAEAGTGAQRLVVSGRVQGVGFRDFTRRAANELGVSGWVRNLSDGRVEVVAEGRAAVLEALAGRLREGPRFARVQGVESAQVEASGRAGFEVRPTGRAPAAE